MKFNLQLRIVAVSMVMAVSSPAQAKLCPPFNEIAVVAKMTAVEMALKAMWRAMFDALSKSLLAHDKQELSAMRVATSQVATAAKAEINANQSLVAGKMAAIGALAQTQMQLEVYQKFSPLTGQGVDPCGQHAAQTTFASAGQNAANAISSTVAQIAAAPGRFSNAEGYMDRLLKLRQSTYATPEEEKLGFGKAAKEQITTVTGAKFALAGADTNAGVLFADSPDPRIKAAKDAYINHIGGMPDRAITKDVGNLPGGKDLRFRKGEKDAAMSAALSSLAMVAAQNTPSGNAPSKAQARRELVGQYFGKDASDRWKGWTTQNMRGLMADQLKIDAAQLALKAELYESGQREEVLLASTLITDAKQRFRPAMDANYMAIESLRMRPSVR